MLKSVTPGTNKTYVGYTNNLDLRILKHNSNKGAKTTKGNKWELIYKKKFLNLFYLKNVFFLSLVLL